jgi:hypothetical protein
VIAAVLAEVWPYLAALAAGLGAIGAAWLKGRSDARTQAEFKRLREQSAARGRADEAADDYRRRGGAADRLRSGRF